MRKLLKKKVNVFGKGIPVLLLVLLGVGLVSAALISFWGTITGSVVITQGLFLDGEDYEADIIETWGPFTSLEAKTFTDSHYLENTADVDADVELVYTCETSNCNPDVTTTYYTSSMENIIAGADRLVVLQASDGSWDWIVTGATGPTGTTYLNIAGVTAQGLLTAYELTGNSVYLDAAKKTGDYLITQDHVDAAKRTNAFSIVFLYDLGKISENIIYTNEANDIVYHVLGESNYWTSCNTDGCSALELKDAYMAYRGNDLGIVMWDLAPWVKAANLRGETDWANDLREIMNDEWSTLSGYGGDYKVIGLSGLILATGNNEAVEALKTAQAENHWTDANGAIQDTAYAVMALMSVNEMTEAIKGANWLAGQSGDGVWMDSSIDCGSGTCEIAEKNSEAIQTMLLTEEVTTPFEVIVPAGESVGFAIVNHFPKMLVPDTYTITTKVKPVTA